MPSQKKRRGRPLKNSKRLRIPKREQEKYLSALGFARVAGVDEVGRGAWAGPLVAAAVILPVKKWYKIRDSKLLSFKERTQLASKIKKGAKAWAIAQAGIQEIDMLGMTVAQSLAYERCISKLTIKPDFLLVDGKFKPFTKIQALPITHGDRDCASIAAASIIAKDYRDNLMIKLSKKYPKYHFEKHKGYGTKLHQEKLKLFGPSKIHRQLFSPIVAFLNSS